MTRKQTCLLSFIVLCLSGCLYSQSWNGIISPGRAINWSAAGVSGGIPTNRSQCGSTVAAYSGSADKINNAITNCPTGGYVQLGTGTFNLSSGIAVRNHSGITVRGMGADKTLLVFSGNDSCNGVYASVCFDSDDTNWKGGISNGPVNWTAGYSKGTTVITLASVPNLKVGNPIILDQADDRTDSGAVLVCDSSSSPTCSLEGNGGGAQRPERNQVQIVTVTACGGVTSQGASCSGTNVQVTISPGLDMPNWRSSQSPQAWWAQDPVHDVGIENVSIDNTRSGGAVGIGFFNVLNGWVKGVRDIDSGRAHVQVQYSAHITVEDSYFYLTQNSVSQSYGFECYTGSDNLVQNNIFQAVAAPLMINGACSGTVLSYNYAVNDYYSGSSGWSSPMSNIHTAGIDNVLYEGNVGGEVYSDLFHGTHNFITMFRNYLAGTQPACYAGGSSYASSSYEPCNNQLSPFVLQSYSRFYNIVGNVLGQTGVQNLYETYPGGPSSGTPIFDLGSGNSEGSVTVPDDTSVRQTLMRWGNYDTLSNSVHWSSSEVPSRLSQYANAVPGSHTLPPSFYLSSKPAWWPTSKPWPAIGPDVTGGNISGVGGHAYTIPAEDCYLNVMKGPAAGTGGVLNFSAAACYQQQAAPDPPTNLTATPQ